MEDLLTLRDYIKKGQRVVFCAKIKIWIGIRYERNLLYCEGRPCNYFNSFTYYQAELIKSTCSLGPIFCQETLESILPGLGNSIYTRLGHSNVMYDIHIPA